MAAKPERKKALDWLFHRKRSDVAAPTPEEALEKTRKDKSRSLSEQVFEAQRKTWGKK